MPTIKGVQDPPHNLGTFNKTECTIQYGESLLTVFDVMSSLTNLR